MEPVEPTSSHARMDYPIPTTGRFVSANGLNIFCLEAGEGEPLLLLHGGFMSTSWVFAEDEMSWARHFATLARHFHVIAPDTRAHGLTTNPTGQMTYPLLADDMIALIAALQLDRPLLCGFSDGGIVGSLVAIRAPGSLRALVNIAGYDVFNPQAVSYARLRRAMGGATAATQADPEYFRQRSERADAESWRRLVAAHDADQGAGYWRSLTTQIFPMWTGYMGTYTFADFQGIDASTLILVGDRDKFCTVEEGTDVFRLLPHGEFGVLPHTNHAITPAVFENALDFLLRHSAL